MTEFVTITTTQQSDYQFTVDFGPGIAELLTDEAAPIGSGEGPSPTRLLLAAVANCLSASLFFALAKFKQDGGGLATTATARVDRNAEGRLRVLEITVAIRLGRGGAEIEHLDRILGTFEPYCTVTQSVRHGIPVTVTVEDAEGVRLK